MAPDEFLDVPRAISFDGRASLNLAGQRGHVKNQVIVIRPFIALNVCGGGEIVRAVCHCFVLHAITIARPMDAVNKKIAIFFIFPIAISLMRVYIYGNGGSNEGI